MYENMKLKDQIRAMRQKVDASQEITKKLDVSEAARDKALAQVASLQAEIKLLKEESQGWKSFEKKYKQACYELQQARDALEEAEQEKRALQTDNTELHGALKVLLAQQVQLPQSPEALKASPVKVKQEPGVSSVIQSAKVRSYAALRYLILT